MPPCRAYTTKKESPTTSAATFEPQTKGTHRYACLLCGTKTRTPSVSPFPCRPSSSSHSHSCAKMKKICNQRFHGYHGFCTRAAFSGRKRGRLSCCPLFGRAGGTVIERSQAKQARGATKDTSIGRARGEQFRDPKGYVKDISRRHIGKFGVCCGLCLSISSEHNLLWRVRDATTARKVHEGNQRSC